MSIDTLLSSLEKIRLKIRRLVISPSTSQISDDDINDYINTFVLYDFPEHIRMFYLRTTLDFYTQPNVDTYSNDTLSDTHPLYNFKNKYTSIHGPMFVAGYPVNFTQSRAEFLSEWPIHNDISSIGTTGDGTTTQFTGTLSGVPVLRNNVLFTSIDSNNNGIVLRDNSLGALEVPESVTTSPISTINYVTGDYVLNFPSAPAVGEEIDSQTVTYTAGRPQAVCFFQNAITLRPVPDRSYMVSMEVYVRPTELLDDTDEPDLAEWWQYIAYGAAKKVLEDRGDIETIKNIMPEFKKQENMILRRTIVQQSNDRVSTIYTSQSNDSYGTGSF